MKILAEAKDSQNEKDLDASLSDSLWRTEFRPAVGTQEHLMMLGRHLSLNELRLLALSFNFFHC